MSNKLKQGEVWLADVRFKGTYQIKQRPVIIVGMSWRYM
ncbi:type II toxin-antitoxin system PemK/MazF family toxin [Bacillus piscicola]|nr:type II toxin-antitoxin system PemK/MazF family toxin [Bacillus piscicola]